MVFGKVAADSLYALVIRRFPKFVLGLFVAGAAVLTLDLTLNLDLFGLLSADRSAAYTVIGGWSVTPEQIYIGFSRLLYPFSRGCCSRASVRRSACGADSGGARC